jgi:hypothetical protein
MKVTGSLKADTIMDSSGVSVISRDSESGEIKVTTNTIVDVFDSPYIYKDTNSGSIHIGQNSMVFDDASSSTGNGWDIMSSSVGKIQIGKNANDTTTFVGAVNVPDPSIDTNAVNRKYADSVAAMAAVLDTKRPAPDTNSNLSLATAGIHGKHAVGLNFSGLLFANSSQLQKSFPLDYSLGIATSNNISMGKAQVGISW